MGDAGEEREVCLGDTEGLVGAIRLAPCEDLLPAHADDAGDAAASMHRSAQAVEGRWIVAMDTPTLRLRQRIPRPRYLVRLRESGRFVEPLGGIHERGLRLRLLEPEKQFALSLEGLLA